MSNTTTPDPNPDPENLPSWSELRAQEKLIDQLELARQRAVQRRSIDMNNVRRNLAESYKHLLDPNGSYIKKLVALGVDVEKITRLFAPESDRSRMPA